MATLRAGGPYIWATWLTPLLSGDQSCEWASWFKAQHDGRSWKEMPDSFDLNKWLVEHTAAVNECRQDWEAKGYRTFQEDQNGFRLRGNTATLAGKPDLIAIKGQSGTIIDIKTGREKASDKLQVMLYMYVAPRSLPHCRDIVFDGEVVYNNRTVSIPASAIDDGFINNVATTMRRLASETPAYKAPSFRECRFCKITSEDCPERVEVDENEGTTTLF